MVQEVDYLAALESMTFRRLEAIQDLMQGHLPSSLIDPPTLTHSLITVADLLEIQFPGYVLTYDHTMLTYYFTSEVLTFLHSNQHGLVIKLQLPISSSNTLFVVWKINAYPIPISSSKTIGNTNHSTLLTGFADNIGQSLDGMWYIEIPNEVYDSCTADDTLTCSEILPVKDISSPSCSLGLFLDSVEMIQSYCSPKLLLNSGIIQKVVPIENDKLLIISEAPSFMLSCHNKPPAVIPLTSYMTIVSRPCNCALRANSFFLPASLAHCDLSLEINTAKIQHTINLPVIWTFHRHATNTLDLSSESLFNTCFHPRHKRGIGTI